MLKYLNSYLELPEFESIPVEGYLEDVVNLEMDEGETVVCGDFLFEPERVYFHKDGSRRAFAVLEDPLLMKIVAVYLEKQGVLMGRNDVLAEAKEEDAYDANIWKAYDFMRKSKEFRLIDRMLSGKQKVYSLIPSSVVEGTRQVMGDLTVDMEGVSYLEQGEAALLTGYAANALFFELMSSPGTSVGLKDFNERHSIRFSTTNAKESIKAAVDASEKYKFVQFEEKRMVYYVAEPL